MKSLYLIIPLVFAFILSACTYTPVSSIAPTAPIVPTSAPLQPTVITDGQSTTPPPTDDQLMQDLSSDPDFKIDSTLDNLDSELK